MVAGKWEKGRGKVEAFWNEVVRVWENGAFGVDMDKILIALGVFVAFVVLRGLFSRFILSILHRMAKRTANTVDDEVVIALEPPLRFVFIVVGLFFATRVAPFPAEVDFFLGKMIRSLIAFTIFWAVFRCVRPFAFVLDKAAKAIGAGEFGTTLRNFAIRIIKLLIVLLGAAAILEEWDFNVGAVLGGLGLMGMAVAFGAQNLISNLFGGLAIFLDRIFAEGDWIKSGDVEGTVEAIGFRTTKVRRFDKALVTLPNSKLADGAVINFSKMTNRRVYWMIGLEYRTTQEQLEQVVKAITDYVYSSPDFETDPSRVSTLIHADSFNASSIDIMLYCFTKTRKWAEWMRVKEEMLYFIKQTVEDAGTGFAFPSSSLYVESLPYGAPEAAVPGRDGKAELPAG